jgi:hypothetical protein
VAAAVLVAVVACRSRPTAGGKCSSPDLLVCGDPATALVCASAMPQPTWTAVPCKGARGCSRVGEADDCDDTTAASGDACPTNPPLDYACTADRQVALVCEHGRFGVWRNCRGPEGCTVEGGRNVRCDTTLGEAGDPCAQAGTYACSVDRKTMLSCDGKSLSPASSCRGPDGCRVERETRKVSCDDAVAQEGDPCDQEGRIACAVDLKAELSCQKGHYVKKRDCRRSDCQVEGNELRCD